MIALMNEEMMMGNHKMINHGRLMLQCTRTTIVMQVCISFYGASAARSLALYAHYVAGLPRQSLM